MGFFSRYVAVLNRHPIKGNLVTALFISFTGDLTAQYVEHTGVLNKYTSVTNGKPPAFTKATTETTTAAANANTSTATTHPVSAEFSPNFHRTIEMNSWALFGLTPLNMLQQGYIAERLWPVYSPASVVSKVLLCVAVTAPNNTIYFTFRCFFRAWRDHLVLGAPRPATPEVVANIKLDLEHKLYDTVLASWSIWTIVNTINFAVVPAVYRHVYTSFFAVCWTSYLSWKANVPIQIDAGVTEGDFQRDQVMLHIAPSPQEGKQRQEKEEDEARTTAADIRRRIQGELSARKKMRENLNRNS